MSSRVIRIGSLAFALFALASCGDSGSTVAEPGTVSTTSEQEDSVPEGESSPDETLPFDFNIKGNVSGGDVATTVAGQTPNNAATTTLAPVAPAIAVVDPDNYTPTYLASDDALGSPRPTLPAEASLESNAARAVSTALRTDASSVLTVSAASWVGSTPMTLRWTITTPKGSLQCDNCAFVTTKVKRLIKEVAAATLGGSGIISIRGLDPTATRVGQFTGNGWGVEFLVGQPGNADAATTGNAIRDLVLSCTGATAATCKNVALGAAEMKWKNQVWSISNCISALRNGGPRQLIEGVSTLLKGASTESAALIRERAALDRVVIGAPIYRPVFSISGTTRTLTGFATTGCAS